MTKNCRLNERIKLWGLVSGVISMIIGITLAEGDIIFLYGFGGAMVGACYGLTDALCKGEPLLERIYKK